MRRAAGERQPLEDLVDHRRHVGFGRIDILTPVAIIPLRGRR